MDVWILGVGAAAAAVGWTRADLFSKAGDTKKTWTYRRSSDASFLCLNLFYVIAGIVWSESPAYLGVALFLALATVALRLEAARLVSALFLVVLPTRTLFTAEGEEALLDNDDEKAVLALVATGGLIHAGAEAAAKVYGKEPSKISNFFVQ